MCMLIYLKKTYPGSVLVSVMFPLDSAICIVLFPKVYKYLYVSVAKIVSPRDGVPTIPRSSSIY